MESLRRASSGSRKRANDSTGTLRERQNSDILQCMRSKGALFLKALPGAITTQHLCVKVVCAGQVRHQSTRSTTASRIRANTNLTINASTTSMYDVVEDLLLSWIRSLHAGIQSQIQSLCAGLLSWIRSLHAGMFELYQQNPFWQLPLIAIKVSHINIWQSCPAGRASSP